MSYSREEFERDRHGATGDRIYTLTEQVASLTAQVETLRREREQLMTALRAVRCTSRGTECWCDASYDIHRHGHQRKCHAATAALLPAEGRTQP